MAESSPLATFRQELADAIPELTRLILYAEKDGRLSEEVRGDILRRLHSLKGASMLVGMPPISTLLHGLEGLFQRESVDEPARDRRFYDATFDCLDLILDVSSSAPEELESSRPDLEAMNRRIVDLEPTLASGPMACIERAYPGIPRDLLDFLTLEQETLLAGMARQSDPLVVVELELVPSSFRRDIGLCEATLRRSGTILSCTSDGVTPRGRVRLVLLAASATDAAILEADLSQLAGRARDARLAAPIGFPPATPSLPAVQRAPAPPDAALLEQIEGMKRAYVEGFDEKIDEIGELLGRLESDPGNRELLDETFRFGHSLKGTAGMFKLHALWRLGEHLEDLLDSVRSGSRIVDPTLIDILYEWMRGVEAAIEALRQGRDGSAIPGEFLARMRALSARRSGEIAVQSRGEAPAAGGASPSTSPPASAPPQKAPAAPVRTAPGSLRIARSKVDAIVDTAGELVSRRGGLQRLERDAVAVLHELRTFLRDSAAAADFRSRGRPAGSVDGAVAVTGSAGTMVSDAKARETAAVQSAADRLASLVDEIRAFGSDVSGLVDRLGEAAIHVRMMPLRQVFQRYPRLVRDVSLSLGKEVDLEIQGEETELDRVILEQLEDPLVHMLRNAVDHGIESPAEREAAGKPRRGKLRLQAQHRLGRVVIELSDDGRGMSESSIGERAVGCGLLGREQLAEMSGREVLDLVFAPGFSTRQEVSEVSGRGVGLDVVRANMTRMQGEIELETEAGRGTTLRLRLPVTLSILPGLMIRDSGSLYCLPAASVTEVVRIERSELRSAGGRLVLPYRSSVLPVTPLREALGTGAGFPEGDRATVAVVKGVQRSVGLAVDSIETQEEIVIKPLGCLLRGLPQVTGVTVRSGGDVAVVLDAESLVLAGWRQAAGGAPARAQVSPRRRSRVLVVEDSATSREMIAGILENGGYEVEQAVDGRDAWRKLESADFDLVVSDVDMPGESGLDLTRRMRASDRHAALPVILVTSLGADEEKREGLEAGANAYLVKRTFDHGTLLARARELVGES